MHHSQSISHNRTLQHPNWVVIYVSRIVIQSKFANVAWSSHTVCCFTHRFGSELSTFDHAEPVMIMTNKLWLMALLLCSWIIGAPVVVGVHQEPEVLRLLASSPCGRHRGREARLPDPRTGTTHDVPLTIGEVCSRLSK